MSILAKHLPFIKEHIAVQEKLAKKFDPGSKYANDFRYPLHVSNAERFKSLLDDISAVDEDLDSRPSSGSTVPKEFQLTLFPEEVDGLPQELLAELSESALPDRGETLLLHVINDRGGIATLDQVLVGLYRKTGEVMKRTTLTSKLYRMTQKGTVFVVPSKKGVYSTRRLSQEDVAAMFGEDQQDAG